MGLSAEKKRMTRFKKKQGIRKKIIGSQERPRLCVFRSLKHVYAQIIDDVAGKTLAAASTCEKTARDQKDIKNKVEASDLVGRLIGERAIEKGIKKVVFDRNGFLYHGRVKAVSDGARKAGLVF
ncbi:MAG: 50S ribosomal protein L18 [Deltaproteobacteria bacterium]|nr:50S ribosomal protein L18 [Deltaproteobacteria bacterium]MBW2219129.1 50S ribosomal protein L18 [Deltaproteobacteria bacterium]